MIYLNNATTTFPKPDSTQKAVNDYLGATPFSCMRGGYAGQEEDVMSSCRQKLADFFNVEDPGDIFFTSGATESLNLALRGLDLDGGHVVTTATEHNAVLRPLFRLEAEGKITLSITDCDAMGRVAPKDIIGNIREDTKAVVVNHCSNVTGEEVDLAAVSRGLGTRGILLIVDAAQSAGCAMVDVREQGIDILVFTGHKALYGIQGTGGIYIKKGVEVRPLKTGGTGITGELPGQPAERPGYYEAGTPNVPGIVSLGAGVDFVAETGVEHIKKSKARHTAMIAEALSGNDRVQVCGARGPDSPVLTFNIKGLAPARTSRILEESYGIITRAGLHCAPLIHRAIGTYPEGSVRVSPSYFTTDDEVERFIDAVEHICEPLS
jgi:cysteine desulfurase / selenocysteine lyase